MVVFGCYFNASAQQTGGVYINVGEAKLKRSLLALTPFLNLGAPGTDPKIKQAGTDLFNTVQNDLDVSSYFQFIQPSAFLEDPSKVGLKPAPGEQNGFDFAKWKQIGSEFLIRAGYVITGSNVQLKTYVYHVTKAELILGREYQGNISDVRRIAHTFSNDIIKALTGKNGYFLSKIAVSSDRGGKSWSEIYVMDWDGYNAKKITDYKSIANSPAWSPDGKTVAYTALVYHQKAQRRNHSMFTYELNTGKSFLISSRPGINSGAVFHTTQPRLFLTVSQGGSPDIFSMNLDGEDLKKLTNGPSGAMNIEPAISPDGKTVLFSSDRGGRPALYTMNTDGSNVKKLSQVPNATNSPAWSPDGKKIAFAAWDSNRFDIFIMNSDGTGLERLTDAKKASGKPAFNEDPTFSPDGRQVMYTSNRTGKKQIYIVNIDGTNERRITADNFNYQKPKWSASAQ
jgi:TolB protein